MNIRRGDRVFVVGTTGSGKTTLAQSLLAPQRDVVIVDPKHMFEMKGATIAKDFRELMRWPGPAPIIYRPTLPECKTGLPWFWGWLWERQRTIAYVDEVMAITPPTKLPDLFAMCVQMGRQKEIGVWCATQRPSRIPIPLLSESEHTFTFRLRHPADLKRMAEYTDPRVLTDPATGHDFWYYGDRDQMLFKTNAKRLTVKRKGS